MSQRVIENLSRATPGAASEARQFFRELEQEAAAHPALHHPFLRRFAEARLDAAALTRFAAQHYLYSKRFARNLAAVMSNVPDENARRLLTMNMYEEVGEPGRVHDRLHLILLQAGLVTAHEVGLACAEAASRPQGDVVEALIEMEAITRDEVTMVLEIEEGQGRELSHPALFRRFLRALGLAGDALARVEPLAETAHFIEVYDEVCRRAPWLEAMGALGPGTECVVPSLYTYLLSGIARSGIVSASDRVFWTIHVRCDEGHGAAIVLALEPHAASREHQTMIRDGALRVLDARKVWFDGLERLVFGGARAA